MFEDVSILSAHLQNFFNTLVTLRCAKKNIHISTWQITIPRIWVCTVLQVQVALVASEIPRKSDVLQCCKGVSKCEFPWEGKKFAKLF